MFTLPRAPTSWLPYVGVKDIHASTEKAVSLGTKVQRRLHEIPNIGWITILVDPTGATFALFWPTM